MPASRNKKPRQTLSIDGRDVPVSNLEKVLFPETGVTKGQIIDQSQGGTLEEAVANIKRRLSSTSKRCRQANETFFSAAKS